MNHTNHQNIEPCRIRKAHSVRNKRGVSTPENDLAQRCYTLWATLYGGDCDFDDCLVELARRLGWVMRSGWGLLEVLETAARQIEEHAGSWVELRREAVAVFFAERGGSEAVATVRREWSDVVEDVLFEGERCVACAMGVPGGRSEHFEIGCWVAGGRTTWEKVGTRLREMLTDDGLYAR